MKSGPEIVKAGLRQFFESAADDIEKMVENLKLGKVSSRNQVRSCTTLSKFTLFYFSCVLIFQVGLVVCICRLKVYLRTSTTPLLPCCRSSLHCLTTLPSTSLEMMSCVSDVLLSVS